MCQSPISNPTFVGGGLSPRNLLENTIGATTEALVRLSREVCPERRRDSSSLRMAGSERHTMAGKIVSEFMRVTVDSDARFGKCQS